MKHLLIIVSAFFILHAPFSVALASLPPAPIPQTGQTSCHDTSGATITCTGTGQDGEFQNGLQWPSPRFVDNGNETVIDKLTGLIWTKDANPAAATKTWQEVLDYIENLNSSNYLGYNDWRLPNINEMKSLLNLEQTDTATWLNGEGFSSVQSMNYWSSSIGAERTSSPCVISMSVGYVYYASYGYIWPVRTGQSGSFVPKTGQTVCYDYGETIDCNGTGQDGELQSGLPWPSPRFTDNEDQSVTDTLTGLVWSKDANPADTTKTFPEALDYIKELNSISYLGHNDWRLPNRNELASLVNKGQTDTVPWIKTQGFYDIQLYHSDGSGLSYWSSSSVYDGAWTIEVVSGYANMHANSNGNYVWPVRSKQYWSFDSLIISAAPKFGTVNTDTLTPSRQIEIGNRGSSEQAITSIAISGANDSEFSITTGGSNPCGSLSPNLAAGANCTLMLGFSPTFSGLKSASIDITASGATNRIPLSGTAISTIFGVVTDQSTGLGVSGATVALNTSATETTGTDGSYTFCDLPAATYSISISKTGYQTTVAGGLATTATSSARADIVLPTTGPLNITSTLLPSATAGKAYSSKVMVAGGTAPYTFSKTYGNLPTGLTLDTVTGTITGTPSGSGSYIFAIGVTDSASEYSSEKEYTIDIVPTLQIITTSLPRGSYLTPMGIPYSTTIAATGGRPPLNFKIINGILPTSLTLNSSTGIISGSPGAAPGSTGEFTFTLSVSDSTGRSVPKQFTISLDDLLRINVSQIPTNLVNSPYNFTLTPLGGYGAYIWSITSGTLPPGITLDPSTGIISGQTASIGTFPLDITIQDTVGRSATSSFTLKIATPLAFTTSSLPAGYIGTTYSQNILTTGGIAPLSFSYTGALPAGLTMGTSTGNISGTPSAAGLTNLSFTVTDSSYPVPVTVTQTVSLRVWNVLSITTTTIPDGTQKTAYSANLTGIGGEVPHSWSIASGALPQGITLDNSTGTITGTAENCGVFPFTTSLTDSATTPKSVDKPLALNIACSNDYIISGNAGVAGATVAYSGTASGIVTADESGNYSIGPLQNGTYVVTPSKSQHLFTPASNSATLSNLDISVAAFTAVLDTSGPTFVLSTLADGAITNNATLNVSGTVSDTSGIGSLTINNAPVTINNGIFSYPVTLQEGDNTMITVATDSLGNSTTDTRTVTLDKTAPMLTVSTPVDNSATASAQVTITGNCGDATSVTVKINNTPQTATITAGSYTLTTTLDEGQNTLTVTATDAIGNTSSAARTITYDATAPTLAITTPVVDTTVHSIPYTIRGTVEDALTDVALTMTVNGQSVTPMISGSEFAYQLNTPQEGAYQIIVVAKDLLENTSTVIRNVIYAPYGDLDNDGVTTSADALPALQMAIGKRTMDSKADLAPLINGVPAPDGKVTAADALVILRKAVGLW